MPIRVELVPEGDEKTRENLEIVEYVVAEIERNDIFRLMLNTIRGRLEGPHDRYERDVEALKILCEQLRDIEDKIDVKKSITHLEAIP
ncbi:hypothetical protein [Thermococcus sp.]|uniref:hypothetical protein n=1 Tax=Thermococcus sp. TaxID=35749 RepID=UPI0025F63EE8|nr:hypothetical protein [Thermococcus sp.]